MARRTLCLTLAACLSASAALAQTPQPSAQAPAPVDAKADGVDLTTFQARHRTRLMKADADHDGRISEAEWTAWWAAHPGKGPADPAKRFRRLDANGDGYVTAEEIDAIFAKRFARLDADHDGRVTRAERPCRCK
ncbi:EF-hand domain-containing protein [Methylobacterium sp. WL8]|uniref:EF-hand domain-containing protein n=1 Tax=Methylobacterium sp. WL8 TaxID=2603899 RepID=UPI0011C8FB4A|nr:EF-hand domain-containing protein [Methylobacterium sp. WL8]TXN79746.1 acid-shock protein [Methylobacterium sp. WL8]